MATVRQANKELRVGSLAAAQDHDLLSTERMMGVGNGRQSQRRLG
jgi:hypothetical protein